MKAITPFVVSAAFWACILQSCNQTDKPGNKTASVEEQNKLATLRFYSEIINKHNPELVDSMVSEDFVEHYKDRHYAENRRGFKKALKDFFSAFPDVEIKINLIMAEKDLVTVQFTMTGTNTGSMFGHKPSNNKINVEGVDIIRFKNGKGIEHWGYIEENKFLRQLSIKPEEWNTASSM